MLTLVFTKNSILRRCRAFWPLDRSILWKIRGVVTVLLKICFFFFCKSIKKCWKFRWFCIFSDFWELCNRSFLFCRCFWLWSFCYFIKYFAKLLWLTNLSFFICFTLCSKCIFVFVCSKTLIVGLSKCKFCISAFFINCFKDCFCWNFLFSTSRFSI